MLDSFKHMSCKECIDKHLVNIIIIVVFLISGTGNTIFSKTAYQLEGEGRDGDVHYFIKPLFFNWAMFLGMAFCLILYIVEFILLPLFQKKSKEESILNETLENAEKKENGKKEGKEKMKVKGYLLMLIPAFCDFVATYLMNFGLIWVSSSIFQMMKGSVIIFTAILTVFYRKRKMFMFEIVSVIVLVCSLCGIGSSAFFPGYSTTDDSSLDSSDELTYDWYYTLIGIALIFVSQFLQAFQNIIEEQLLQDINAPVTFVVGLEGLYGLIICSALMPIMNMDWIPEDLKEDSLDTFIMLGNSPSLIGMSIAYVVCIFCFNVCGMIITDKVNAMVRNVMEPLRMIVIWIVSVFLYYVVDEAIGEKVGYFTIVEVIGFIFLTFGFLMYTKVIKFPKVFEYPMKDSLVDAEYEKMASSEDEKFEGN